MKEKIIFSPQIDIDRLNRTISMKQDNINRLADVLKRHGLPSDIEGIADRAEKGWDWERRTAREEIENYISKTEMPSYLQEDARSRAEDSIDEDLEKELQSALIGWDGTFSKEDLETDESGHISFKDEYKARMMKGLQKTLSESEMQDLEELRSLLKIYQRLDTRYNMPGLEGNIKLSLKTDGNISDERLAGIMYYHRRKR